jgi:hypothetical protein
MGYIFRACAAALARHGIGDEGPLPFGGDVLIFVLLIDSRLP